MKSMFNRRRVKTLIDGLQPERLTRIVDVGANPVNEPPYSGLLTMGACEVWGFEPQEDAFSKLQESAGEREHHLPYAVGDGDTHTLRLCRVDGFSSLLEPNEKALNYIGRFRRGMAVQDRIEVATHRLDDIDDLPEFDLLKIDIQGAETSVFDHGRQKLAGAVAVISEVAAIPLYTDQPLLDEQMSMLRGQGFYLHKFQFFKQRKCVHPLTKNHDGPGYRSQMIDGDGVFIRDLLGFESIADENLKHLAILADAVIESFDLTLLAMDALEKRGAISKAAIEAYLDRLPGRLN